MAQALWLCEDARIWEAVSAKHQQAIEAKHHSKKKSDLIELQRWYASSLPVDVKSRKPLHMSKDELVKLVKWKLERDKFRPRLVQFAEQQTETAIKEASMEAIEHLSGLQLSSPADTVVEKLCHAMDVLTKLKGVGPATASAILSALCPHGLAAYMSPPAMTCTGCKHEDYSKTAFKTMMAGLQDKAKSLQEANKEKKGDAPNMVWNPRLIEECLFTTDMLREAVFQELQGNGTHAASKPAAEEAEAATAEPSVKPRKRAKLS